MKATLYFRFLIYPHLECHFIFLIHIPVDTSDEVFILTTCSVFYLCAKIGTRGTCIDDLGKIVPMVSVAKLKTIFYPLYLFQYRPNASLYPFEILAALFKAGGSRSISA